ncbi:WD domain, G-beta repeat protein [Dictyocaulus viviparus]|uniref:Elongator complex protein 2 n=1 Tax=Dictyocaulus viviparus TaxID=29172 RepID=A0A0D8XZ67_DICVI|nr:WD domain, G-beta repeat protein [Dictyocaulus viviparus]
MRHLLTLGWSFLFRENGIESPINTLCGTFASNRIVVDGINARMRVWWFDLSNQLTIRNSFDIGELKTFVTASDMQLISNGKVLLAVGTTGRMIELFCETTLISAFQAIQKVLNIAGHEDWIHSLAFNQRNPALLATAGQDTFVKLWRIEEVGKRDNKSISVTKNLFEVDGDEGKLLMSLSMETVLAGHNDWVHSTQWDSEGRVLLTSSSDKTVIVWKETCDGKLWNDVERMGIVGGQAAGFLCAVFSPDAKQVVASSYYGGLYSWVYSEKDNSWKAAVVCSGHTGAVRDVVWHPDGEFFISVGEDKTSRVYTHEKKLNKFIEVARPQVHGHSMQCLCLISRSIIVSGAEEKIFRVFEAPYTFASSVCNIGGSDMTKIFGECTLVHYGAKVPALGLSNKAIDEAQEEEHIVNGHSHWEEDEFQAVPSELRNPPTEDFLQQNTLWPEVQKLYGHGYEVYTVTTNPNGTVMATSCKASQIEDAAIVLWDTSDWTKKSEIFGHQLTVTQVEWSPDGTRILSVSRDRTAIIYRERHGNLNGFDYETIWSSGKQHTRIIWSCCWFDDSKHFLTASRDMKVILWKCCDAATVPLNSFKCPQSATSVAICCSTDIRDSIIVVGLQDGSLLFLQYVGEALQFLHRSFVPITTVDSPVLRLRVNPKRCSRLAIARSDGKLQVIELTITRAL